MDHNRGVIGHWETGVANKLDGAEYWQIAGEAREVWNRTGMDALRTKAMAEVDWRHPFNID